MSGITVHAVIQNLSVVHVLSKPSSLITAGTILRLQQDCYSSIVKNKYQRKYVQEKPWNEPDWSNSARRPTTIIIIIIHE